MRKNSPKTRSVHTIRPPSTVNRPPPSAISGVAPSVIRIPASQTDRIPTSRGEMERRGTLPSPAPPALERDLALHDERDDRGEEGDALDQRGGDDHRRLDLRRVLG